MEKIFLNLDYKNLVSLFIMWLRKVNVEYRFHKKVKGQYINENGIKD